MIYNLFFLLKQELSCSMQGTKNALKNFQNERRSQFSRKHYLLSQFETAKMCNLLV